MNFEIVSLDQLTMFLAVVETGTFSAAGRSLGRVQSAVSHAVAALESSIGVKLFDRSGREPKLTDAGRRLVGEARLVLSQVRSFQQQANELHGGVEPELDLVLDTLFPRARLVSALTAFHQAFPLVTVRVHVALLDEAVGRVLRGEVDFGVCNIVSGVSDPIVARPLTEVVLVPVCALDHPLARTSAPQPVDALRKATQIVLAEGSARGTADQGVLSTRTWRVADLETKLALLLAGVGWGSLPRDLVDEHVDAGRLVRLRPEPWAHEGHVIRLFHLVRADHPLGPAGRWLTDALESPPRRPPRPAATPDAGGEAS